MEYDKIRQLMEDMGNSKLTAIDIDFPDGTKVSMKKEIGKVFETNVGNMENVPITGAQTNNIANENVEIAKNKESVNECLNIIKSPMVGTFYLKPAPTSDPYVQIGSKVNIGQTVCIVEAMKLMNEIESEFDGEICEIYVKDGDVVEYGTPLFGVK